MTDCAVRAIPHRPVQRLAVCACILSLVTGAWFGQAIEVFGSLDPLPVESAARSDKSVAWAYYEAINAVLLAGDATALDELLSPDFVDHRASPIPPAGREDFARHLGRLRATQGSLRVWPAEVVVEGDLIAARFSPIQAGGEKVIGLPLSEAGIWPSIEFVRVDGERVVERWGDGVGHAIVESLMSESLTFATPVTLLPTLARVSVARGSTLVPCTAADTTLVRPDSGGLPGSIVGDGVAKSLDDALRLSPDTPKTTVVGPGAMMPALGSAGLTPTVAFVLRLMPLEPVGSQGMNSYEDVCDIRQQALAGDSGTMFTLGETAVDLVRVTLPPGAKLDLHLVKGIELVAVEQGTLATVINGEGLHNWLRQSPGRTIAAEPTEHLSPGVGLSVTQGSSVQYGNDSLLPVTFLLVKIVATDDAG